MTERIMVVDDNLTNLQYISSQLAGLYQVLPAKSGVQALHIAAQQVPDLILLDVDMPQLDGFETFEKLTHHDRLAHIPVIFLTARHDPATEMRALELGARDFIAKPIEKSILLHRIDLHLRYSYYRQHLQHTVKEMEDSVAVSFAELIECRDENTGGHVRRTREYVSILGKALRERGYFEGELQDQELEMMVRAAPLHDVGKIGISDRSLLKPGRLTASEFEDMKRHTVIGASILEAMYRRIPTQRYLRYAKIIAESHHERYDGKGYPYGKCREDIPLPARIMAVADVYDALVANRIYRNAVSHEEACRVIIDGKGTSFDPHIVDVFEVHHQQFRRCKEGIS
ncbi:response regulator [Desulfovibrio sp. OttesenSCG-928-O18]|nr:response regulator [Desulfovibrio sp. OttesenSCG-928-O18]